MTPSPASGSGPVKQVTIEDARSAIQDTLESDAEGLTISDDSRLEELGLSSLEVVEIFFALESLTGREIDSTVAAEVQTVGDLLRVLNGAGDLDGDR
ncbi:MAG: phosphopantetheine-binding protein [Solirubrobacteraceae bacterium]